MAAEHISVQVACRVLDVSTSGYYALAVPATIRAGDPPCLARPT